MKPTSLFGISFVLFLVCAGGCAANHPAGAIPTTGRIRGIVVDAHQNGVGSTTIILLSPGSKPHQLASTLTDEYGNFILDDLSPGEGMSLSATRNGRANILTTPQGTTVVKSGLIESGARANVTVTAGKVTDVGAIKLTAHAK